MEGWILSRAIYARFFEFMNIIGVILTNIVFLIYKK